MYAFLGLGSNLSNRFHILQQAVRQLGFLGNVLACSNVYETDPVGGPPQPAYLNAAILLETALTEFPLLQQVLEIEQALGRTRQLETRNLPRTIDIDILLLGQKGQCIVDAPQLNVPHPRLHERAFALLPLLNLDSSLIHPVQKKSLLELYQSVQTYQAMPVLFTQQALCPDEP